MDGAIAIAKVHRRLGAFAHHLRQQKFDATADHLQSLQALLVVLAAKYGKDIAAADLCKYMAPVLCNAAEQQQRFPQCFAQFFGEDIVVTTNQQRAEDKREAEDTVLLGFGIIACGIIAFTFLSCCIVSGRIVDHNGEPVANARITSYFTIHSDQQGKFTLPLLPTLDKTEKKLSYQIAISSPQYPTFVLHRVQRNRKVFEKIDIRDVTLVPWQITGRVIDSDGKPVAQARIYFAGRQTRSGESGEFIIYFLTSDIPDSRQPQLGVDHPHYQLRFFEVAITNDPVVALTKPIALEKFPLRQLRGTVSNVHGPEVKVRFAGSETSCDEDGNFQLSYRTRAKQSQLIVEAPNYQRWQKLLEIPPQMPLEEIKLSKLPLTSNNQQRLPEEIQPATLLADFWRSQSATITPLWGNYYLWLAIVALLMALLAVLIRRYFPVTGYPLVLRKQKAHYRLEVRTSVSLPDARLRYTSSLQRPRREDSAQIDYPATAKATAKNTGIFTPAYQQYSKVPAEYLLLIDRSSEQDQHAVWVEEFSSTIARSGLHVEIWYLEGDLCRAKSSNQRLPLQQLARRYHQHRLLLYSDGRGIVGDRQTLPDWFHTFRGWPTRALFTPRPIANWQHEWVLAEHNFAVLPATHQGLQAFIKMLGGRVVSTSEFSERPLPRTLAESPQLWLDERRPWLWQTTIMLSQLRRYLGEAGYYWLQACATHPQLHWQTTLHLGKQLQYEGKALLDDETLSRLLQLPWFRHNHIPQWLRLRLTGSLSRRQRQDVLRCLQQIGGLGPLLLQPKDIRIPDVLLSKMAMDRGPMASYILPLLRRHKKDKIKPLFIIETIDPKQLTLKNILWKFNQQGVPLSDQATMHRVGAGLIDFLREFSSTAINFISRIHNQRIREYLIAKIKRNTPPSPQFLVTDGDKVYHLQIKANGTSVYSRSPSAESQRTIADKLNRLMQTKTIEDLAIEFPASSTAPSEQFSKAHAQMAREQAAKAATSQQSVSFSIELIESIKGRLSDNDDSQLHRLVDIPKQEQSILLTRWLLEQRYPQEIVPQRDSLYLVSDCSRDHQTRPRAPQPTYQYLAPSKIADRQEAEGEQVAAVLPQQKISMLKLLCSYAIALAIIAASAWHWYENLPELLPTQPDIIKLQYPGTTHNQFTSARGRWRVVITPENTATIRDLVNDKAYPSWRLRGISYDSHLRKMRGIADSDELWAVTTSQILHSPDNGTTWTAQQLGDWPILTDLHITPQGQIWCCGARGAVFHYSEGQWRRKKTDAIEDLYAICAPTERQLWCVGEYGTMLHSTDGGESWSATRYGKANLRAIATSENSQLWAVGDQGTVLQYDGQRWQQRQNLNTTSDLHTVYCANDQIWIAGEKGTIRYSPDGGKTWQQPLVDSNQDLLAIYADGDRMWCVGAGGTLLHSVDGGKTWPLQMHGRDERLNTIYYRGETVWVGGEHLGTPLTGLPTRVACLAYNHRDHSLVVGSDEGLTRLAADFTVQKTLDPSGPVSSVAYSDDGEWLASAHGKAVKIWHKQKLQRTLRNHSTQVISLSFHPDQPILASVSRDAGVLWNYTTGKALQKLAVNTTKVRFHPDQKILAVLDDEELHFYHLALRPNFVKLEALEQLPLDSDFAFSSDGVYLASAKRQKMVLLTTANGEQYQSQLPGFCFAFAPGDQLLACGYYDGIRLWDVAQQQLIATVPYALRENSQITFSSDGQWLLCCTAGKVHRWKLSSLLPIPDEWPLQLWKQCWEGQHIDFTTPAWAKLSAAQQGKLAGSYQRWYAQRIGLPVERDFHAGGTTLRMVLIPPGKFLMGSPKSEPDRLEDETQHPVIISKAFWMAKYEITQGQWKDATGEQPWQQEKPREQNSDHPATDISWHDINDKFVTKLGNGWNLPTEAQWEYACRAGTLGRFYWGEDEYQIKLYANTGFAEDGFVQPAPIGKFRPNGFRLHDMIGNILEWCRDGYGRYPAKLVTDPIGSSINRNSRVMRGGTWLDDWLRDLRSACRPRGSPAWRNTHVGGRFVIEVRP